MDCEIFFLILYSAFPFVVLIEVAKVERTQNFEHASIFKATVIQVVLSLMGVFVEFFHDFVSSGTNLLLTLVSIRTI